MARIVIHLEGGFIQNVITDIPIEVLHLDHDTEGCDEVRTLKNIDGNEIEVFDLPPYDAPVNPEYVDYYFRQFQKGGDEDEEND
jgi:hypothetical protein